MCPINGSNCGGRPGLHHHHATGEAEHVMAIDTYDGHRMAMAYSLGACAELPVNIKGRHVHSRSWDLPQQLRRAKHLHQELDQNAI